MLYYVDDERLTQEKLTHKAVVKVMRALIDMGASVSLLREDWYNNLRLWWRGVKKAGITINQADRKKMTITRMV